MSLIRLGSGGVSAQFNVINPVRAAVEPRSPQR